MFIAHPKGQISPLLPIEPTIVSVIIQLARIRQCINPTQVISLINSMIKDSPVQDDLIKFKKSTGITGELEDIGKVGFGYWRGFKERNRNKIVSKKGKKYEMDRSSWSTYSNFNQMYDGVMNEFVDAGVAVERDTPAWMDKDSKIVDKSDAFGCIVAHDITHPDYIIVMDEVGGNTSQKGDGYVGGKLMLCETRKTPQQKINTKNKHYTLLGLTALSGKPIMCCVIFSGVNDNVLCETGFDMNAECVGSPDDPDFSRIIAGLERISQVDHHVTFEGKKFRVSVDGAQMDPLLP